MKLTTKELKLQAFNVLDIDEVLDNWTKFSGFQIRYSFPGTKDSFHATIGVYDMHYWRNSGIRRLKVLLLANPRHPRPLLLILNAWPGK
jgi:hypothetical protein